MRSRSWNVWQTLLLVVIGFMVSAQVALAASVIVIFKDGTVSKYDLPQDVSQVQSITLSGDSSVALSGNHQRFKDIVFTENFDQGLRNVWASISVAGGDFARFGRVERGKVLVSVPAGNSWGKTGVRTLQPVFRVDDTMKANPMQIALDFDLDGTTGYIAAIAPESHPDVVHAMQSWFHWYRRPNGEAGMYLRTFQTNQTASLSPGAKAPTAAPRQIVFSVRPGSVEVSTSSGEKFTLTQEWLRPGTPVYLHVHSHPGPEGEPASFALETVTAGR
jgi:hypothetical protein